MKDVNEFLTGGGTDPEECIICYKNTFFRSKCDCQCHICETCLNRWINEENKNYCSLCAHQYFERNLVDDLKNSSILREFIMPLLQGQLQRFRESEGTELVTDEQFVRMITNLSASMLSHENETDEEFERTRESIDIVTQILIEQLRE